MITKQQAIELGDWHSDICKDIHYTGKADCARHVGKRGGIKEYVTHARPNGKCQTWKRDPLRFRLPVKHGMYDYGEITQDNAGDWHLASDCPLNAIDGEVPNKKVLLSEKTMLDVHSGAVYVDRQYGYPDGEVQQ